MNPILTIAIRAARKAGNFIAKNYEIPSSISINQKKINNFMVNIDHNAEFLIHEVIYKSYPKHTILSKKNIELINKDQNIQWVIDSLSGASNFIRRFPYFSVSIAVRIKNRTEVAVIYDPIHNELFTAIRGQGAQLNGYRLRGSYAKNLNNAILATGFPSQLEEYITPYTTIIRKLCMKCVDFRRTGSIALDLAYVASGRMDGFLEMGLKPYNFVAGELIIRESSGLVTDFIGGHNYFNFRNNTVAGNPYIVKMILSILCEDIKITTKY